MAPSCNVTNEPQIFFGPSRLDYSRVKFDSNGRPAECRTTDILRITASADNMAQTFFRNLARKDKGHSRVSRKRDEKSLKGGRRECSISNKKGAKL